MNQFREATILNASILADNQEIERLMSLPKITVYDTIDEQILELLLCRNPLENRENILQNQLIAKHKGLNNTTYGNWVYYSWLNILVHILPENEFVEVRTNRNRNKITVEEQELLRTKKVGVAGLSVGRTVALTIAQERIAGEIVLADFDNLELSNLNRIKVGVDQLGVNKSISAAREIALIDPYLVVRCFTEGLNRENLTEFFTAGGTVDLFIEECDDLPIKVHSRITARELQIPVLMEASDRCLVDIERFDFEPSRALLHGIMDEAVISNVSSLKTFEEKLELMSKIVDVNNISERMRLSLPEIGVSLRTWPQLGSDVTFGGGVMAHLVRKILLGEPINSGRYYFEIERSSSN